VYALPLNNSITVMKSFVFIFLFFLTDASGSEHHIKSKYEGKIEKLDSFNTKLQAEQITISGLSSGADLAVNFQVAFSSVVSGACIVGIHLKCPVRLGI